MVHWEINAKNAKTLSRFYAKLFDWNADTAEPDQVFMDTESEEGIDGSIIQTDPDDPVGLTFYVHVPDLEKALVKVTALGGKIVVPATEMPDGVTLAVFEDPEGNHIGLVQD